MLRIVGASDSIEVHLFEEQDVLEHAFLGQSFAPGLIVLVPTDSLQKDGLVVVEKILVLDLIPLQTHLQ